LAGTSVVSLDALVAENAEKNRRHFHVHLQAGEQSEIAKIIKN
jgi:hypothetical protein